MTWAELAEYIGNLSQEQQQTDVTVYVSGVDEFYPLVADYPVVEASADKTDVLDDGHPYLVI